MECYALLPLPAKAAGRLDAERVPPGVAVVSHKSETQQFIVDALEGAGFNACPTPAAGAAASLSNASTSSFVIIDADGGPEALALCSVLRSCPRLRIVLVNASSSPADRIRAFDLGADRVLSAPLRRRELIAVLRAMNRRIEAAVEAAPGTVAAGWRLRPERHELLGPDGAAVTLTPGEFRLVRVLAEHHGRVLSRAGLLKALGLPSSDEGRRVDRMVWRIRRKLAPQTSGRDLIQTLRRQGYRLDGAWPIVVPGRDEGAQSSGREVSPARAAPGERKGALSSAPR